MSYYDEELEGMVNSIEKDLNKLSNIRIYSMGGFCLSIIGMFYTLIRYSDRQNPPLILYGVLVIAIISYLGGTYQLNNREKYLKI